MIKNQAGQAIGAQMINASNGAAYVGTVTVYVTGDAGTQAIGTVGSGICQAEGNGYFSYQPSQAETNFNLIAFTFIGSGAIPATIQVQTISAEQTSALSAVSTPGTLFVSDLITAALKRINAVNASGDVGPEDMQDAFLRLNSLLESFQLQGLTIPYINRTTWTITSTKGILGNPYTVGTGGDINTARPSLPNDITVRYQDTSVSPTLEYRMNALTPDAWALIPQKNLTSPLPTNYYYQPTYAGSLGSLYLWMVPTQSSLQGVLYCPAQIPIFGATTDSVILPPGYFRMLRDNLAIELSPEWDYNAQTDPMLMRSAAESLADVKRANVKPMDMAVDPALTGPAGRRYSIYSDGPW